MIAVCKKCRQPITQTGQNVTGWSHTSGSQAVADGCIMAPEPDYISAIAINDTPAFSEEQRTITSEIVSSRLAFEELRKKYFEIDKGIIAAKSSLQKLETQKEELSSTITIAHAKLVEAEGKLRASILHDVAIKGIPAEAAKPAEQVVDTENIGREG